MGRVWGRVIGSCSPGLAVVADAGVPQLLLIDMITDPDPVKASKAMQAMMTMVKIDSEQLEHAVAK